VGNLRLGGNALQPEINDVEPRAGSRARGWFAGASPEFRHAVLALARPRSVPAGAPIYHADTEGRDVIGVQTGVVCATSRFSGADAPLTHLFRAGDWFGAGLLLGARSRRATVVALTDVTLLRVPGDDLEDLLRRRPEWWRALGACALEYGDLAAQAAADLLIRDAERRCCAVLLRLAGRCAVGEPDADAPAEIPLTQSELGGLCNVSRNKLNDVLRELAAQGAVVPGYRSLIVVAPAKLRALAEG
jgi:CRP/FNR family transcriptional regulator, cyclic AMP receptor protein